MRLVLPALLFVTSACAQTTWSPGLLPPEQTTVIDSGSGARVTTITNHPKDDVNLYFHQRAWLPDSSLMVFRSDRTGTRDLHAFIAATGALARLGGPLLGDATVSRTSNRVYVAGLGEEKRHVGYWGLALAPGAESRLEVKETLIAPLPEGWALAGLTETSDGKTLVLGMTTEKPTASVIFRLDIATGALSEVTRFDFKTYHVQASWTTPDLVMFCPFGEDRAERQPDGSLNQRMWLVDTSGRAPWPLYPQLEGEIVTHESFWVNDTVTFLSGIPHEGPALESHLKVVDVKTGRAHIAGAGAWLPGLPAEELARANWWHAAGSPDGRFLVADNWHGDIAIFSAQTARCRILTSGHRAYGKGEHPHVGWRSDSRAVHFGDTTQGNVNVVVAELPEAWLTEAW